METREPCGTTHTWGLDVDSPSRTIAPLLGLTTHRMAMHMVTRWIDTSFKMQYFFIFFHKARF